MIRVLILAGCAGAFATAGWALQEPTPFKPGKLPKEEQAALQPGLTLRFFQDAQAKAPLDTRRIRLPALHVPAGGAASPFLSPGPFAARMSGYVKSPLRGEYGFRLVTTGRAALSINGKDILEATAETSGKETETPIDLAKGYNRIEVRFHSPAQGDATLRLYWSGEGFGWEPIPPEVLFSRGNEPDLVAGVQLREGRFLYATLGCARCHALPEHVKLAAAAMPEMQHQAPSLVNAGHRFRAEWLAKWIADPRSLRPEATMPHVLHGDDAAAKAADIAAYLGTVKTAGTEPTPGAKAEAGEKHFQKLGCVTCHHLKEPAQEDELKRLSLWFVKAKFQDGALGAFLRQPHQHYPWIRMPDFKLSAKEAAELAAYLLREAQGQVPAPAPGNAERGKELFQTAGCIHCHRVDSDPLPAGLPAVGMSATGCLAADADKRGKAPDFALSAEQRQALTAFLKTGGASLLRESPAEFAQRQVQSLQCQSCHRRDGASTRWHQVLEEEGKMPEALPSLTWAGQKLKHEWATRLLAGQAEQRARPWLKARMPAFPARAELLAQGLSHEHGYSIREEPAPAPDAKLASIGAQLLPQQGGFNCIMCHGVGKQPAIEPFEAPGINLLDAALRLRHEYYERWMISPTRVDVVTRMPVFSQDGKTTALRGVFEGDAQRQFEAIWHYMQTLPGKEKDGK
jgi:cytochrome c2